MIRFVYVVDIEPNLEDFNANTEQEVLKMLKEDYDNLIIGLEEIVSLGKYKLIETSVI